MTSIYDIFETDAELEEDGMWVTYTPEIRFKIRRANSEQAQKVMRKLMAPYKSITRSGRDLPRGVSEDLERQWVAQAILVDWAGVTDRDGKELPFSVDKAMKVLAELPDMRREIANLSGEAETFRRQQLEDDAKNSEAPSDGASDQKESGRKKSSEPASETA